MKMFSPAVRIMGAMKKRIDNPAYKMAIKVNGVAPQHIPEFIEVWDYPAPAYYAKHFKNAAARAKFNRGEISEKEAFKGVPVYAGVDNRVARSYNKWLTYRGKREQPDWKAAAASIRSAKDTAHARG